MFVWQIALEDKKNASLQGKDRCGLHTVHHKILDSLYSRVLSCATNPLCTQHRPGQLPITPMGRPGAEQVGGGGEQKEGNQRNHEAHAACCAVIKSRVSEPRVSHLWPASMKLWQAHLLACK